MIYRNYNWWTTAIPSIQSADAVRLYCCNCWTLGLLLALKTCKYHPTLL